MFSKSDSPNTVINPRSNLTVRKYQKNTIWRGNKIKELLFKGYNQQEIVSILHVGQPTTLRDITLLYNQQEKKLITMESYCLKTILIL